MTSKVCVSYHTAGPESDGLHTLPGPCGLYHLPRVPLIPEALRRGHRVLVPADTRFKAAARFLQALWREDRNLPIGLHADPAGRRRPLGSRISIPAGMQGANFLDRNDLPVVARALAYREIGAVYELDRLRTNLLSSQPLAFNLFAPLVRDLTLATRVMAELFPRLIAEVTEIAFEHSPGRGDPRFSADGTAYDVIVRGRSINGDRVFVAIEIKYSEGCHEPPARMTGRYPEIAPQTDLFIDPAEPGLYRNPCQQLFRQHCLASTILNQNFADRAVVAFVAPMHNQLAHSAAVTYSRQLRDPEIGPIPFVILTLERVIAALAAAGSTTQAHALHGRYTDFWKVDMELHLDAVPESPPGGSTSQMVSAG